MFDWLKKRDKNKEIKELLKELSEERRKFTKASKEKMQDLVDQLIELGVYPETSKSGYSALQMVEGYDVNWYTWSKPYFCRHCDADLRDHVSGPPFKREIGQYDMGADCTVGFKCPDCNKLLCGKET